ncbi:redox-sensing transcriptional repressor Rex [Micrococcoides hystricis]|uniref:Redox-sensing transcriptional repressor Rex n=1 Tax=Micrococcoides hystricis TaxID=1572761 RepID=A0ABV6PD70_9MICC
MTRARLSAATISRLPVYLRVLNAVADEGQQHVSSSWLAQATGVNSDVLRKDLSALGSMGRRGVGYQVDTVKAALEKALGLGSVHPVVLIGAGHLGQAIAGYRGFSPRGYQIAAIIDADENLWGTHVAGLRVQSPQELPDLVAEHKIGFAIVAVPAHAAQAVADQLCAAGVRGILNFAPVELTVPEGVQVRGIDLAHELQILTYLSTGQI